MAWRSGLSGLLSFNGTSAAATIRNWQIDPSTANVSGAASDSSGGTFVIPGVRDFTGRFQYYNVSPLGFARPGNTYVFYGQNPSGEYRGGVIVTSTTIEVDIENGGIIGGSSEFASIGSSTATLTADNNALTYSDTPTSLTNTGTPNVFSSIGCKAAWAVVTGGALGSYSDIPSVRRWSLTLTNTPTAFSNSGTGGVIKRIAGLYSASASVSVHEADPDVLADAGLTVGSVGALRLYTSASAYWQATYMLPRNTPADVQIENPNVIGVDLSFDWSSHGRLTGGFTKGAVVDPASVTWF